MYALLPSSWSSFFAGISLEELKVSNSRGTERSDEPREIAGAARTQLSMRSRSRITLLLYCCFTAALLLLYCCFTTSLDNRSGEDAAEHALTLAAWRVNILKSKLQQAELSKRLMAVASPEVVRVPHL